MAKLVQSAQSRPPVFFNVDGPVGQGGRNTPEDVALATFLMRAAAPAVRNPAAKAIHMQVNVANTCSQQLVRQIMDLQRVLGKQQDGRISVANPSGSYGSDYFLIVSFNFLVRQAYADVWPRLDKIAGVTCPSEVRQLVMRSLVGA